jgi:adenylosuccinate synthase
MPVLDEATPVYVEMPGWSEDISRRAQFSTFRNRRETMCWRSSV